MRIVRTLIVVAGLAAAGLLSVACNTMQGIGRDVEDAGDAIEDAAD